mmetsp:Transcript_49115/g.98224  ORF Transcript_49115/g.98224 Transcript_49115/m.98224 type:complete len:207 (+) Transcript_49115:439-1059(+)
MCYDDVAGLGVGGRSSSEKHPGEGGHGVDEHQGVQSWRRLPIHGLYRKHALVLCVLELPVDGGDGDHRHKHSDRSVHGELPGVAIGGVAIGEPSPLGEVLHHEVFEGGPAVLWLLVLWPRRHLVDVGWVLIRLELGKVGAHVVHDLGHVQHKVHDPSKVTQNLLHVVLLLLSLPIPVRAVVWQLCHVIQHHHTPHVTGRAVNNLVR